MFLFGVHCGVGAHALDFTVEHVVDGTFVVRHFLVTEVVGINWVVGTVFIWQELVTDVTREHVVEVVVDVTQVSEEVAVPGMVEVGVTEEEGIVDEQAGGFGQQYSGQSNSSSLSHPKRYP